MGSMRTTVTLDDDVAAAVERLRRDRSIGLSEAINELIRAGLTVKRPRKPFRQQSEHIGFKVDVTNVAEALELLEDPAGRARSTRRPSPG
jgi:metal-responsive CopG/Arc/MetJ family transcriptional regulator